MSQTAWLGAFAAIELPAGAAASCGVRSGDRVAIGALAPVQVRSGTR
jgi:hypothetical protein